LGWSEGEQGGDLAIHGLLAQKELTDLGAIILDLIGGWL
jgi:hypothetical protein